MRQLIKGGWVKYQFNDNNILKAAYLDLNIDAFIGFLNDNFS